MNFKMEKMFTKLFHSMFIAGLSVCPSVLSATQHKKFIDILIIFSIYITLVVSLMNVSCFFFAFVAYILLIVQRKFFNFMAIYTYGIKAVYLIE